MDLVSMSSKVKAARKVLPVIPAGVEPAVSPRTSRANAALATPVAHSPLISRSGNNVSLLSRSQPASRRSKDVAPGPLRKPSREGEDSSVRVAVRVRPLSKR